MKFKPKPSPLGKFFGPEEASSSRSGQPSDSEDLIAVPSDLPTPDHDVPFEENFNLAIVPFDAVSCPSYPFHHPSDPASIPNPIDGTHVVSHPYDTTRDDTAEPHSPLVVSSNPIHLPSISKLPFSSSQPQQDSSKAIVPLLTLDTRFLQKRLQSLASAGEFEVSKGIPSNIMDPLQTIRTNHSICSSDNPSDNPETTNDRSHHASPSIPSSCKPKKKARRSPSSSSSKECVPAEFCLHPKSPCSDPLHGKVPRNLHPTITIDFWGVEELRLQPRDFQPSTVNNRLSIQSMDESDASLVITGDVVGKVGLTSSRCAVSSHQQHRNEAVHGSSSGEWVDFDNPTIKDLAHNPSIS